MNKVDAVMIDICVALTRTPASYLRQVCILLIAVAVTMVSPIAQALLIKNGGFELQNTGGTPAPTIFGDFAPTDWTCNGFPSYCNIGAVKIFAPGTASINTDGGLYAYSGFPYQSPALGNFLSADPCYGQNPGAPCKFTSSPGTSTIYQNVGILNPGNYVLTFWQAAGQWNGYTGDTTVQWEVGLGDKCLNPVYCPSGFTGEIEFSPLMSNLSGSFVPWNFTTLNFIVPSTAAGVPQILSFMALGSPAVPPLVFLDGVNLSQVPEPTTLSLLGGSLLGLILVGLRRRAAVAGAARRHRLYNHDKEPSYTKDSLEPAESNVNFSELRRHRGFYYRDCINAAGATRRDQTCA